MAASKNDLYTIIFYVNLIYIIIASIFGNKFIQNGSLYILILLNFLICLLELYQNRGIIKLCSKNSSNWCKTVIIFVLLMGIYIVLSFFDFFRIFFDIDVAYRLSFIPRQAYIVLMVPYIYVVSKSICETDIIEKIFSKTEFILVLFVVFLFLHYIGFTDFAILRPLSYALITALLIKKPKNILVIVLSIIFAFTLNNPESSTSWLSLIVAISVLVGYPYVKKIWFTLGVTKSFLIIAVVILALTFLGEYVENIIPDANTQWRWQYWMNEIDTLKKTGFCGVGYGTAYASNNIYSEINNPYVFAQQESINNAGLFVIAQHNSFMNFFYRMGILGFFLAIESIVVQPLNWFYKIEQDLDNEKKIYIKWALTNLFYNLTVIAINAGLESPRFSLVPCTMFGIFMGLLYKFDTSTIQLNHNEGELV